MGTLFSAPKICFKLQSFKFRETRNWKPEIALSRQLLLISRGTRTSRWPFAPVAELTYVDLQFSNRPAESIAMHIEFARGAALIAFILLQHSQDELFLELADSFRVENIALVHLHDKRFELILHGISLSS